MTSKLNIQINQSIISALGRKLYESDFALVVMRELIQNSLDASSTRIDVTYDEENRALMVCDNGTGIKQIQGLLDTIGESCKSESSDTIGGFGIAKLAIYGCKQWSIVSQSGKFSTGFLLDESVTCAIGTEVVVSFAREDVAYSMLAQIANYLRLIKRPHVTFVFNGETIKPFVMREISFAGTAYVATDSLNDSNIVVRVNGLPSFLKWVSNLKCTIVADYQTTLNPYHPDYPLTSNRDAFRNGTAESRSLIVFAGNLQNALETEKRESEKIKKNLKPIVWRGKAFIAAGNITESDFENASMTISTYRRYLIQIAELNDDASMSQCHFGLTDQSDDELGAYMPALKVFLISNKIDDKGTVLAIALHEYTHHLGYSAHDQLFANCLTSMTSVVMTALYNGNFRR